MIETVFYLFSCQQSSNGSYKEELTLDGANGVGGSKVKLLKEHIGDKLSITVVNDSSTGKLNFMVRKSLHIFAQFAHLFFNDT